MSNQKQWGLVKQWGLAIIIIIVLVLLAMGVIIDLEHTDKVYGHLEYRGADAIEETQDADRSELISEIQGGGSDLS